MRRTRTIVQTGALAAIAMLAIAAPAGALAPLPTGNLVDDGDEYLLASPTGNHVVDHLGRWTKVPANAPATRVMYGAPGFPTVAQAAEMGAGLMFFAGGPSTAADTTAGSSDSLIYQNVFIPAEAQPYIAAGEVQVTVSACLGGYANQEDYVSIDGGAHRYGEGRLQSDVTMTGPGATARNFQTKLLPRSVTVPLPAGTAAGAYSYMVAIRFLRTSGQGTYNDAYADKVEVRLSELGSTPPDADCTAPQPPGGPPAAPSGAPPAAAPSSQHSGSNTALPLTQAARRIVLTKRYALVKLGCAARTEACAGTLTLSSTATKLGSAKFAIGADRTATIKVRLGAKARRVFGQLSARRLAKLKVTATARVGARTTTFTFGAKR